MSARPILLLALLAGAPPALSEADALGRLFLTPAERAALVEARRRPPDPGTPAAAGAVTPAEAVVPRLRLDGLVHREGHATLAFLNQRPIEHGTQFLDYRVYAGPHAVTLVQADGRQIRLQVGQTLLREEGRIVDPVPPESLGRPR